MCSIYLCLFPSSFFTAVVLEARAGYRGKCLLLVEPNRCADVRRTVVVQLVLPAALLGRSAAPIVLPLCSGARYKAAGGTNATALLF